MTVKNLIARLISAAVAFAVATTIYELIVYVVLRPLTNQLVESQLSNTNMAPSSATMYFNLANGLLGLCYLLLILFVVFSILKYRKTKE
jgi:hypothetical protein